MLYAYSEDHGAGHHSRHQHTYRSASLPTPVTPVVWHDISHWQGKHVWGKWDGKREKLYIVSRAPEGKEGERWYAQPDNRYKFCQGSVLKADLELIEKPVTCTALMIVPSTRQLFAGIKKAIALAPLTTNQTIYL